MILNFGMSNIRTQILDCKNKIKTGPEPRSTSGPAQQINQPKTPKKMETIIRRQPLSRGRYKITAEIEGQDLSTTTTDTEAIDAAFNEEYNGQYRRYPTQEDAKQALLDEILTNQTPQI